MNRVNQIRAGLALGLLLWATGAPGQEMTEEPDAAPVNSLWIPPDGAPPVFEPFEGTYWGGLCMFGQYPASMCIGAYEPEGCGSRINQDPNYTYQEPWEAFGALYYQDSIYTPQGCYPLGFPVEELALHYDELECDNTSRALELPTFQAKFEAIEGLGSVHNIPLDVYSGPTPPVAAARYYLSFPGSKSPTEDTHSGILVWVSAFYDSSVFHVEVMNARIDPNNPNNFLHVTRTLATGNCMLFRPRGSSVFVAPDPNYPDMLPKDAAQHMAPTYKIWDDTYRRRGWIKIKLANGVSIRDAAGQRVLLRAHTLNWVGNTRGCPDPNDGGDRWHYRLTDEVYIGVGDGGETEAYPVSSPPLTDEAPIDTISAKQQKLADEAPVVNLVNEMNVELPSITAGHCEWKAGRTYKDTLGNVAYYHRLGEDAKDPRDVVRMNIAGVWFCHDDIPGWYLDWQCYSGFYYLQVVDPLSNKAYTYVTSDKATYWYNNTCDNWYDDSYVSDSPDGVVNWYEYFDDYAYLVDIDYDPNSGEFPGPGDRFLEYDPNTWRLVEQYDFEGNGIQYAYVDDPNGLAVEVTATAAGGSETRTAQCTFGDTDYHQDRPLLSTSFAGGNGMRQYEWYPMGDPNDPAAGKILKIKDGPGTVLREFGYDSKGRLVSITRGAGEPVAAFLYEDPNDPDDPNDWKMTAKYYVDATDFQGVVRWFGNAEDNKGILLRTEEFHDLSDLNGTASVTQYEWDVLGDDANLPANRRITTLPNGIKQIEVLDPNKQGSLMETYWAETDDLSDANRVYYVSYQYQRSFDPGDPNYPDWGIWQKTSQYDHALDANTTWTYDEDGFVIRRDDPVVDRGVTTPLQSYQEFVYRTGRKLIDHEKRIDGQGNIVTTDLGYDDYDNVTSRLESCTGGQRETRFEFNAFGQETGRIDPNGNKTVKEYENDTGRLVREYTFEIGASGNVVRETSYSYQDGRLHQIFVADHEGPFPLNSPDGWIVTAFGYDTYGRVTTRTISHTVEPNSYVWSYEYDRQDRIAKITYPDGTYEKLVRDGRGLVRTQEVGHSGTTVVWTNTYDYDDNGNLSNRTCQSSGSAPADITYFYDDYNRRTGEIHDNSGGDDVYVGYDYWTLGSYGNADISREYTGTGVETGIQQDSRYLIDNLGRAWTTRQIADPNVGEDNSKDRITALEYDRVGNVVTETIAGDTDDGADASTAHTYDWRNFRLTTLEPNASESITYDYDDRGNVIEQVIPATPNPSVKLVHDYDGAGQRIQTIYKEDDTTKLVVDFVYDSRGHKVRETKEDAEPGFLGQDRWSYDMLGFVVQHARMSDPNRGTPSTTLDRVTDRQFDEMGRLATKTTYGENGGAPATRATYYIHDEMGRLTLTYYPADNVEHATSFGRGALVLTRRLSDGLTPREFTYVYDSLGRRLQETETVGEDSATTAHGYDVLGRRIQTIDAEGMITTTDYDGLDQVTSVTRDAGGLAQTATKVYTQLGHLLTETANDGTADQTTTYTHDLQGRRTQVELPDAGTWVYVLDQAGRVQRRTDPIGTVTDYTRNWRGQVVTKRVGGRLMETFDYDPLGRRTLARRDDIGSEVTRAYDAFGNIITETQAFLGVTKTFSYTYHPVGTRQDANYPDVDGVFQYEHNDLDNVTKIKRAGSDLVAYEYAGRLWTKRTVYLDPNSPGTLVTTLDRNRLARRIYQVTNTGKSGNSDVFKETINTADRDRVGNPNRVIRSGVTATAETVDYWYDGLHRVTGASYDDLSNEGMELDLLGNRQTYMGRDANEVHYQHNTVNEYTSITPGPTTPTYDENGNLTRNERGFKFMYDYENRLWAVLGPLPLEWVVSYGYDALGRRLGEQRQAGPGTMYFYDGDRVAVEYDYYGDPNQPLRYYVHGPTYTDEVAVLHDGAKEKDYAYALNDRYSVIGLMGQDGRLIRGYAYDLYGQRREIVTHWDLLIGIRNHLGQDTTPGTEGYDVNADGVIDLLDLVAARIPPDVPSVQRYGFQGRRLDVYKMSTGIEPVLAINGPCRLMLPPTSENCCQTILSTWGVGRYGTAQPLGKLAFYH